MTATYIHGYGAREGERLNDQAEPLADLVHGETRYPEGSAVLEVGCGIGAQTVLLARHNPGARITSVDASATSLDHARRNVTAAGFDNVDLRHADISALPFTSASFDHVFVCFVLEHLPRAADALATLVRLLRPGGTLTAIEGDHGATVFHPESASARAAIACQEELQRRLGGDPTIGRRLYPLLSGAGLNAVRVLPRIVYVDGSRPDLARSFTLKTFTAMIEGVRDAALAADLANAEAFDAGLRDLRRTAEPDGTFCYTFFKGVGTRADG